MSAAKGPGRRRRRPDDGVPKEPVPISDLAHAALRNMAGTARGQLLDVMFVWRAAVGERIAGVATPKRLAGGILTVAVVSPVWSQQLSLMATDLIASLNAQLGREMVRELRFSPAQEPR